MLAKRIIPTMLVRGRTLVKGTQFNSWRSIGHAAQAARIHAARGVDELCILDIAATAEKRGPDLEMVRELSEGCFIPITVGGGVRSIDDIDALLRAGADKVAIGTGIHEERDLLSQAADRFGGQAIVASIDVLNGRLRARCGTKLIGWYDNEKRAELGPDWFAARCQKNGVGEILLTCIERDGMQGGYDLDLIRSVSSAVSIPVIASGGCGSYSHMLEAFHAGADACAAGALFSFTDATPRGAAQFLKRNNIEVRL